LNTQSSATVALRALVMLVCLVIVPIAAIFGFSIPDSIRQPIERYLGINMAPATSPLSEAPRFVPNATSTQGTTVSADARPAAMPLVVSPAPLVPVNAPPLVNPLGSPQAQAWAADPASSAIIPAGYQSPVEAGQPAMPTASAGSSASGRADGSEASPAVYRGAAGGHSERFTMIEQRLRELGATYFLLESWGSQGQLYRFYCKMAIGGNPNYNRYFEATDPDPIRVMAKVLGEVEAWRASPH
jgi:hypothetical protein